MKRWFRLLTLGAIFGITAGGMTYGWLYAGFIRCLVVDWHTMDQIGPRLYVHPSMTQPERQALLRNHTLAKKRVIDFFGSLQSDPVVIAGTDSHTINYFGSERAQTGMTHLSPLGGYIVLDGRGLNVDVLAHEMVHAELLDRLGWYHRTFHVPTWFDEGLAMQIDYRFPGAEAEWAAMTINGTYAPPLRGLTDPKSFFGNPHTVYLHYLTAQHEVGRWYGTRGQRGILQLIACLRAGGQFDRCYGVAQ